MRRIRLILPFDETGGFHDHIHRSPFDIVRLVHVFLRIAHVICVWSYCDFPSPPSKPGKKIIGDFFSSSFTSSTLQLPNFPHCTTLAILGNMENTRIFVSGLPPTLTNEELGKHFSARFQVTDSHVIPNRRIGFVGFKDADVAMQAAKYFNKTYLRMSKISVEMARPVSAFLLTVLSVRADALQGRECM